MEKIWHMVAPAVLRHVLPLVVGGVLAALATAGLLEERAVAACQEALEQYGSSWNSLRVSSGPISD